MNIISKKLSKRFLFWRMLPLNKALKSFVTLVIKTVRLIISRFIRERQKIKIRYPTYYELNSILPVHFQHSNPIYFLHSFSFNFLIKGNLHFLYLTECFCNLCINTWLSIYMRIIFYLNSLVKNKWLVSVIS